MHMSRAVDDADPPAVELLFERLARADLAAPVAELVLGACLGADALETALGGERVEAPAKAEARPSNARRLYLGEVAVEGFRGIAGRASLGLRPGPGLTLVVGRNGSGKSSFAEAVELALTGTSSRWERRPRVWEQGWACIHHDGPRSIELRVVAEGEDNPIIVRRRWAADAALAEGASTAQAPGAKEEDLSSLGLDAALSTWRPFLPYSELGGLVEEGPSRLYDAISSVLGLEEWSDVERLLTRTRQDLEGRVREATAEAARLRELLAGVEDERALRALEALPERGGWDLDTLEQLASGAADVGAGVADLEQLMAIEVPDPDAVTSAVATLRGADEALSKLAGTDAERAAKLAELLEQALAYHEHDGDETCPVCGTASVLDEAWRTRSRNEVERLRGEAEAVRQARDRVSKALADARRLAAPLPSVLEREVPGVELSALAETWRGWTALPDSAVELAAHLEETYQKLSAELRFVQDQAGRELRRRRDLWQPVAGRIGVFLQRARVAQERETRVADLRTAAAWVAAETEKERNERFAPIAERVRDLWHTLRQSSNVELEGLRLTGRGTQRRVELDVSVDAVEGAALSVMSQGELHALALSLFLPRATQPGSPFRFLVIDDPVQSMDAARVDGLALVLAEVAKTHQVIVFTHDERLPDACRRLRLDVHVLEVNRGKRSTVTVRAKHDPVDDYLADARAVLATDGYPTEARRRVVPGLCRQALEAACCVATRRRLLAEGVGFDEIEARIDAAGKLYPRLALALFGDAERGGDVLGELNRRFDGWAGDCVRALNRGSHELVDNNPELLTRDTEKLAHAVADMNIQ